MFTYLRAKDAQERRDKVAMTGAIHILNTKSAKTLSTTLGYATHDKVVGVVCENEEIKLFQSPKILVCIVKLSTIEGLNNNNINQPVVGRKSRGMFIHSSRDRDER